MTATRTHPNDGYSNDPKPTPNLKIQRHIIELLGEFFDEKEGRYRNGWSDEKIATTVGTSLEVVKLVRREAFGALQEEDPAIAALKSELKDVRKLADEYKAMIDKALDELNLRVNNYVVAKRFKK